MKIVCLNTWLGKRFNELMAYIKALANDVDIFCLQDTFLQVLDERPLPYWYRDIFSLYHLEFSLRFVSFLEVLHQDLF